MNNLSKVVVAIIIIGILPLLIGGILDGIGVIDVGTGLGLGLFMIASIMLSIIVLLVGVVVLAVKKLYNKTINKDKQ